MWFLYRHRKLFLLLFLILLLSGIALYLFYWKANDLFLEYKYDLTHQNSSIYSQTDINQILDSYPSLAYNRLEKEYLNYTKSNTSKYKGMLKHKKYIIIPKTDIYRKIVGDFRIKDFMCKDKYYKDRSESSLVWLVDRKLIYKTLELLQSLEEKGYNPDGFYIRNGHRHPTYNEAIKGASKSRHIKGEAVDIIIQDINNDGKNNQADKTIVYDLLNKEIIVNQGGIGRYPGTMSVHYDVRGTRARWDSY